MDDFRKAQMSRASDILKMQAAEKADRDKHLAALYKVRSALQPERSPCARDTCVTCSDFACSVSSLQRAMMLTFHVLCLPPPPPQNGIAPEYFTQFGTSHR